MYELYIGALTLAYLAAYAAAMRLKTGKAALMGAAIWVFFSFIAGPLLLSSRSGLAGHGLGEAIADFALLLITVLSGVFGVRDPGAAPRSAAASANGRAGRWAGAAFCWRRFWPSAWWPDS